MDDLYLYHATDRKNLKSIMSKGLLIHPPKHNWDGMYCENQIFLALNAKTAEDYAGTADNAPEDIVVLKIDIKSLNSKYFRYDWNNRCEYHTDINSCVYTKDIQPELLQECDVSGESDQNLDDFTDTDLYNILLDTFWEECETNKEREGEYY